MIRLDMLDRYGKGLLGCVFNDVLVSGAIISSGYGYGYGYGEAERKEDAAETAETEKEKE